MTDPPIDASIIGNSHVEAIKSKQREPRPRPSNQFKSSNDALEYFSSLDRTVEPNVKISSLPEERVCHLKVDFSHEAESGACVHEEWKENPD